MKNIYKKVVKHFDNKKGNVFIQRKDDENGGIVYVCDGFTAFKVALDDYEQFFRTEKPYYIPLENGQYAKYGQVTAGALPTAEAEGVDIDRVFRESRAKATGSATATPFAMEQKDGKYTRIFKAENGGHIAINNAWYEVFRDFNETWKSEGNSISPVIGETTLFLPVRLAPEVAEAVKNI